MSTVKTKKVQLGTDATASNNFTIYQPATPDGTLRIGVGNADSPTEVGRFNSNGYKPATAPAFSVYNGTGGNVSVSTNTWTKVILNTEEFDTNNDFDSTTNYRFTPTVAGYYQINGMIGTEGSGTTTRTLAMIRKNGGEFKFGDDLSGNTHTGSNVGANALIYMNGSTDYLELWIYMTGTSTHYNTSLQRTYFQGYLVQQA